MYYNADTTLSRDRLFNFVVGARGAGKTYGAKDRAIRNFLKRGEQFVYIRRYETELPAAEMRNFFDDIAECYPDHEFVCGKGLMRCDGRIMGWYIPLSKAIILKSIPFPKVSLIIFDEFIIDVGVYRYLQNEVHTFLECYSTISRDRDVKVLFLSNAITFTNPYFIYFNLSLEPGQTLKLLDDISLELVQNGEYIEHVKSTRFGRLMTETEYGKYAMENKFLRDTDTFITDMREKNHYVCTLKAQGLECGVYNGDESNLWYITPNVDKSCKTIIALDVSCHDINTLYGRAGGYVLQVLVEAYCKGNVRFTDLKSKNIINSIFKKLI